jgi:alpha-methylacyl-CoA racemase
MTPRLEAQQGPLAGKRVIELGPGPIRLTGSMFADLGAAVVSITAPSGQARRGRRQVVNSDAGLMPDARKQALGLNLQDPRGQEVLRRLCRKADVLIEGFRPGVVDRLGAGYNVVHTENPALIYCSVSGYGQTGPYRDLPGHDLNYLAVSGCLDLIGRPGEDPTIPLNLIADYAGASLHAAVGILAALVARERTGRGQHIDISFTDATFALLAASPLVSGYLRSGGTAPSRGVGLFSGTYPYYSTYRCSDGRLIAIAALETHFWTSFCEVLKRPDLGDAGYQSGDHRRAPNARHEEVRSIIESLVGHRSAQSWFEQLAAADVPCSIVLSVAEAIDNEQLVSRGMVSHDVAGEASVHVGSAIKLSDTPSGFTGEPEECLKTLHDLGYRSDEITSLTDLGVLECH